MKNHIQSVMEELFPHSFLKNQNWAYRRNNSLKFYTVCFFIVCQAEAYWNSKLICRLLSFTSHKAFLKTKRFLELVCLSHAALFLKKIISLVIFYELTKFNCVVAFTCEILGNMCIVVCSLTRLCRHKFWN